MINANWTPKRSSRRRISRRKFLRCMGLAGLTLLSGGRVASLFGSRSRQADADQLHKVYLPLVAKVPPIPPPSQELVQKAYQFYELGDPVRSDTLFFQFKPNLNNSDQPSIIFGRDPKYNEIILATRYNLETRELVWHIVKPRDLADAVGIRVGTNFLTPYVTDVVGSPPDIVRILGDLVADNFNHAIVDQLDMNQMLTLEPDLSDFGSIHFGFEKARRVAELAKANAMTVSSTPLLYGYSNFHQTWGMLRKYWVLAEKSGYIAAVHDLSYDEARRMNADPHYGNEVIANLISSLSNPEQRQRLGEARNSLREFIAYYVRTVVSEYQGKVDIWRVVNEFDINPKSTWDPYFWLAGPDYPDLAFRAAREADPDAKLIMNPETISPEANAGDWSFSITFPVTERLRAQGLIDGVGDQGHENAAQPFDWEARFALLGEYGLEVSITERDVDLGDISGSDEERFTLQAERYATALRLALMNGVRTFSFWECFGDKYNWLERMLISNSKADPTLFYDDGNPKLAYFAVKKELQETIDQE